MNHLTLFQSLEPTTFGDGLTSKSAWVVTKMTCNYGKLTRRIIRMSNVTYDVYQIRLL